ncbi:type II toxin-antitoxin system toxin DNA ADP-ribosyl transferase DarT [Streptomyces sp. NPDC002454]
MLAPEDSFVYHFTHVRNVPSILEQGFLKCDRIVREEDSLQVECGDVQIKERRRSRKVESGPGGVVSDYVPFYFAPRSPMLYKINKGGVPSYASGQDPLVYLVTTPRRLLSVGCACVFSDGNCAADITVIREDMSQLASCVDWAVMQAERWNNTAEDPDRMRRRMAEYLAHQRVPVDAFERLAVRTDLRAAEVSRILETHGCPLDVLVRPSWYY